MFSNDRTHVRKQFIDAWQKARDQAPLEPLEQQIVEVVRRHPEYQPILEQGEASLSRDWLLTGGETNPFLHMGLHLALLDQITTDRPPGMRKLYQRMVKACLGDTHEAEHRMLACLAEELWQVQQNGGDFRTKHYQRCIKRQGGGSQRRGLRASIW
jgi:hypothetical protein